MRLRLFRWLSGALIILVALELAARGMVVLGLVPPRILTLDPVAGWRNRPGLDIVRMNADGAPWRVATDREGLRLSPSLAREAPDTRTLLILGDSFAFGEGVSSAQRFDAVIARARPAYAIVNTGVMGYGLDQALLANEKRLAHLKSGDVVLVLLYRNDITDVQQARNVGRPKPVLMRDGDGWRIEPPQITWLDRLRDGSYVVEALARHVVARERAASGNETSHARLTELLRRLRGAMPLGVKLVLAHFGAAALPASSSVTPSSALCQLVEICVPIEDAVPFDRVHYQSDGHWTAAGHGAAGHAITTVLTGSGLE